MTERSDAELVTAHLAGDRSALAAIYDRYADSLYDTAAAMLRDRHDAEDLAHDVFVVASRSLTQLRDPARLKPWLFAILRHEVYKRTKRRSRSRPTDFTDTGVGDMAATPDAHADGGDVEREELATFVRAAAAGLAERDQLLLELSVRQGLAGADLAAAVGVTPEQCHVLVHRMRERVQRSIGALTVARYGRNDCPDLQTLLQKWNGVFDPPTRKRIAGHVDDCAVCGETSRRYAMLPLLAGAPALAAPASLRDRVLASTAGAVPGDEVPYRFDAEGGFPRLARGVGRAVVAVAIAIVAVLLLGGTWLALASGNDDDPGPAIGELASGRVDDAATSTTASSVAPTPTTPATPSPSTAATSTISTTSIASATSTSSTTTSSTTSTSSTLPPATTSTTVPPAATTTVAPVAPPPTDPPVTPPPPPPPPPGLLSLSTSTVDLGATAPSATFTVSNTGGQPIDWSINGDRGPFSLSSTAGTLAPGASANVTVGLDRGPLAEGDIARSMTVTTATGNSTGLRLLGAVEHAPVVTVTSATSSLVCPFTTGALMRVTVSDESAVTSVVLSWTGPGAAGQSNMRLGAGGWSGRVTPEPVNGTWSWIATATDARGNTGSAGAVLVVAGC